MDEPNVTEISEILSNNVSVTAMIRASCNEPKFIIHTVVAGIICLIGFVGNAVSLYALSKDKQSPVASFLLQALTLIDNMFLGIWFLQFSLKYAFKYADVEGELHVAWAYIRLYTYPVLFAAQTATIWMTVVIAASRYISICIPFRAAQLCNMDMARKSVAGVIIFSIAYNTPRFFEGYLTLHRNNGTLSIAYHPTWLNHSHLYKTIYFDILYYIFSFVLPLLVLSVLNTRLTLAYRKIQATRARMNLRTDQDNNITLVMIIVVLVFMLCQAPARIVQIVWKYEHHTCSSVKFYLTELSNVLEVFNSSANFFIYCAFRKQFRTILIEIFCGQKYRSVPNSGSVALNGRGSLRNNGTKTTNVIDTKC